MKKNLFISRIAPTPSGYLHFGNGVNFLLTWLIVRSNNGFLQLRIDDIDSERVKNRYIDNIFESLEFLGINWDGGAKSPSDYHANYAFKNRVEFYREKLKVSILNNPLFYSCVCSRKEIQANTLNGLYPQTCFNKNIKYNTQTSAIRLHVKPNSKVYIKDRWAYLDKVMGDFVVWRKGGLPAYQFASLMDDEALKSTLIVRGDDLFNSSLAQRYMATILKLENFSKAEILHHRLCLNTKGEKLSKTTKSKPILESKDVRKIYKEVANILYLEHGATDSLQTLQEAYKSKYPIATLPKFY